MTRDRIPWKDGEALFFIELKVINLTKTTTKALPSDGSFSFKEEGKRERERGGRSIKLMKRAVRFEFTTSFVTIRP